MNGKIQYHSVVIEHDGKKPNGSWYDRLHRMGIKVRGNKDKGIIERRQVKEGKHEGSIIIQEGNILCSSRSLALQIAHMAVEQGATVLLGTCELEMFKPTKENNDAFMALDARMAKRGPKDKGKELLVCLEEAKSYIVEGSEILCPHCRAASIEKYPWTDTYAVGLDDSLTNWENWLLTRFCSGNFVIPVWGEGKKSHKPKTYEIPDGSKVYGEQIIDKLCAAFGNDLAFRYLDSVFIANNKVDAEYRMQSRARSLMQYLQRGGAPTLYTIGSSQPDILDSGMIIGVEVAASLALQLGKLK